MNVAFIGQSSHDKCVCRNAWRSQRLTDVCIVSQKGQDERVPNDGEHWQAVRDGVTIGSGTNSSQLNEVLNLLRRHQNAFSTISLDLGRTSISRHVIDTGDAPPVRQPPRHMAQTHKQQVENIIGEMREQGLIRPSTSPWSSSIVLVKKKSGELRFCVDYRQVNEVTKKNSYPIPRIDDSLDEMSGSVYFSTLDLKSGYWQIPMDERSREKTAFASHMGLFEFNVMPMGLCNSAASFQRLMRIVLQGIEWQGALAYLDDIIIYASFDEHMRRLEDVLLRLIKAGLTLKPSKCDLFKDEVRFLGHIVSKQDHSSIRWLWRSRELYGQCARWVEHLAAYHFEMSHRPGTKHSNADALSRVPEDDGFPYVIVDGGAQTEVFSVDLRDVSGYNLSTIVEAQHTDQHLKPVLSWVQRGIRPSFRNVKHLSAESRHFWSVFSKLTCRDNMLFIYDDCVTQASEEVTKPVVPISMREDVLTACHDMALGGGHLGIAKTLGKISERFYWFQWRKDTEAHCRRCNMCNMNKKPSTTIRAHLVPSQEVRPMQRIEIDVLGPLPLTRSGYQYVLVSCDLFTKYVRALPMRHQSAHETAGILFHRWLTVHGVPEIIHSDRGGNFESELFAELVRLMGCTKSRTTAYHPVGNGGVERNNRTIISMLRNYVQRDPKRWDEALSAVVASYNASRHESTGLSPHFLLTGHQLRLPADLISSRPTRATQPFVHLEALRSRLLLAEEVARETLEVQRQQMEQRYNKKIYGAPLREGDIVLLENTVVAKDGCRKFLQPYKGPFKIVATQGTVNHVIQDEQGAIQTVHYNRLKKVDMEYNRQEESGEENPTTENNVPQAGSHFWVPTANDNSAMQRATGREEVEDEGAEDEPVESEPSEDENHEDSGKGNAAPVDDDTGLGADIQNVAERLEDLRPRRNRRQTVFYPNV
uniref:Gypsy retrotransposon integrase-like protein 1 n=1 Tax=Phallusia mammillata TaxID=59560 RepID=A0A6F9DK63_9ASCI|nr:uncharacterized protein LOC108950853 [Phallusia mammillata]